MARIGFAALLACLTLAPIATAAPLKPGIYDCMGSASGYVNSVKIKAGGDYIWASQRKGKTLKHTTTGRYRVVGKKIKWLSGTYKRGNYTSTIYSGYFSIDRAADGIWTGISCYLPKTS